MGSKTPRVQAQGNGKPLDEIRIVIRTDSDLVAARQEGRRMAERLGFGGGDRTLIATAISELARNILRYADHGEVVLLHANHGPREGMTVVAQDKGPGIKDLERALEVGYSTSGGLGLGLPGVRRLMDVFNVRSSSSDGTVVSATKWKP
jgi:serine/threonine-protein kinase RsbT